MVLAAAGSEAAWGDGERAEKKGRSFDSIRSSFQEDYKTLRDTGIPVRPRGKGETPAYEKNLWDRMALVYVPHWQF